MKKFIFIFFLIFFSGNNQLISQSKISDYEMFIGEYVDKVNSVNYIVLRQFKDSEGSIKYLAIDPSSLNSLVISSQDVKRVSWEYIEEQYKQTNYIKLRNYTKTKKYDLKNSGIQNIQVDNRYIITTDLCPSPSKLDYDFYKNVYEEIVSSSSISKLTSKNNIFNLPVGIAISGIWIKYHKDDLNWLLEMEKNNKLSITWINHSYNHRYIRDVDLSSNFLLIKGTDINKEILKTEEVMIEEGLNISIYFRFPGLVSDSNIFNKLLDYGLIPLGADSWIGKGQYPKDGSIVLVHTNGNDAKGLRRFQKWLKKHKEIFYIESINNMVIRHFK